MDLMGETFLVPGTRVVFLPDTTVVYTASWMPHFPTVLSHGVYRCVG